MGSEMCIRDRFCIILLCFVCGSGSFSSGSPYFFCRFENRFSFVAHVRLWLRVPALQGSYYLRSGTFLLRQPGFEGRVLLAVRDRFDFGRQFCKKSVINGPGPFLALGVSFERSSLLTVRGAVSRKTR